MDYLNINIISALICLITLVSIIRGITHSFKSDKIFNYISNAINGILFLVSFLASIYITTKAFVYLVNNDYRGAYGSILETLASYVHGKEIILYIIFISLITMALLFLLSLVKSFFDRPLRAVSDYICRMTSHKGKFTKAFLGIVLELPKAAARIVIMALLINILISYYSTGPLSSAAEGSRIYNCVNSYAVSPIVNSNVGRSVPVLLEESMGVISEGLENSSLFQNSDKLKYLGFLRFQYETKSSDEIDNMARRIVGKETDERKKAYLLYNWIGENIDYDWDKYNNLINGISSMDKFGAIPAFETGKGVCEDYSDLYVAMARAVGLKVRIIVGQGYTNNQWGGHAWNEVYISNEEKWVSLDTTWARAGDYFDSKDFDKGHVFEAVAGEW